MQSFSQRTYSTGKSELALAQINKTLFERQDCSLSMPRGVCWLMFLYDFLAPVYDVVTVSV